MFYFIQSGPLVPVFLLVFVLTNIQLHPINCLIVEYDALGALECFHEIVSQGDQITYSYEVIDGSTFHIDVSIYGPNNKTKLREERRSNNGKIRILAKQSGSHEICFSSPGKQSRSKWIMFDIDVIDKKTLASVNKLAQLNRKIGDDPKSNSSNRSLGDSNTPPTTMSSEEETSEMVNSLLLSVTSCKHDVRYLAARDRTHRRLNETSNKRIVWWALAQVVLLFIVTVGQVYYVRRFFEIRRKC